MPAPIFPPPSNTPRRQWATQDKLAEHLGCSTRTVARMKKQGYITAHRVGKGLVRYDLNEIDEAFPVIPSAATPAVRSARPRRRNTQTTRATSVAFSEAAHDAEQ